MTSKNKMPLWRDPVLLFVLKFLLLFAVLYGSYLSLIALTAPGGYYIPFLDKHLNAVHWMRWLLLHASKAILQMLGYTVVLNEYKLLVAGHNLITLNYDCLGFAVMCFFTAFVITFPKPLKQRLIFLGAGLFTIQLLNVCRLVWLALFWRSSTNALADQHTIFNVTIYIIIAISIYYWIKHGNKATVHAPN